jgi:polyhydroxyalkanoate synthesis regulator phasin
MPGTESKDSVETKTPKDDVSERIDELDKKIDKLEDEAVPKEPDPPGVGAMF